MALENSQRYIILGSKLLPLFVEKLFADTKRAKPGAPSQEGNDADHEVTKWALIAQSFSEADVKQATRGFKISQYWQGIMNVLANYSEFVHGSPDDPIDGDSELFENFPHRQASNGRVTYIS